LENIHRVEESQCIVVLIIDIVDQLLVFSANKKLIRRVNVLLKLIIEFISGEFCVYLLPEGVGNNILLFISFSIQIYVLLNFIIADLLVRAGKIDWAIILNLSLNLLLSKNQIALELRWNESKNIRKLGLVIFSHPFCILPVDIFSGSIVLKDCCLSVRVSSSYRNSQWCQVIKCL